MASDSESGGADQPERRLIGAKLSAQHVLRKGEEIEPGVYRIDYADDATVVAEFGYATITEVQDDEPDDREEWIEDDNGDDVPRRSEPADFGGGESTGVQEL